MIRLKMLLKNAATALLGSQAARRRQKDHLESMHSLANAIEAFDASGAHEEESAEAPIFILSAGWRSGSTLLQRLLMSDGKTLIWGEPYDRSCIIQRLSETLFAFSGGWPPKNYVARQVELKGLSKEWTANLYPPFADLKKGYRQFFDAAFARPAGDLGASRWGIKEVRLGINEARFLRWVYPHAKFVFIYRNPFDAFDSYKSMRSDRDWYSRWPSEPVFTPKRFGEHWRRLVEDFRENADAVGGMVIKYEDLVSGTFDLDLLARYCAVEIDPSVLTTRVGSSSKSVSALTRLERLMLEHACTPATSELGYSARPTRPQLV